MLHCSLCVFYLICSNGFIEWILPRISYISSKHSFPLPCLCFYRLVWGSRERVVDRAGHTKKVSERHKARVWEREERRDGKQGDNMLVRAHCSSAFNPQLKRTAESNKPWQILWTLKLFIYHVWSHINLSCWDFKYMSLSMQLFRHLTLSGQVDIRDVLLCCCFGRRFVDLKPLSYEMGDLRACVCVPTDTHERLII